MPSNCRCFIHTETSLVVDDREFRFVLRIQLFYYFCDQEIFGKMTVRLNGFAFQNQKWHKFHSWDGSFSILPHSTQSIKFPSKLCYLNMCRNIVVWRIQQYKNGKMEKFWDLKGVAEIFIKKIIFCLRLPARPWKQKNEYSSFFKPFARVLGSLKLQNLLLNKCFMLIFILCLWKTENEKPG